jgi:chromosome segregation and condensation protein ScpB
MIKRDSELKTIEEITERLKSIKKQLDKLDYDNPKRSLSLEAFAKKHEKYKKLTAREEVLWDRRADMLKQEKK